MSLLDSLRSWWCAFRLLRHPSLVLALQDLQTQRFKVQAVLQDNAAQRLRLDGGVVIENWAPHRLKVGYNVAIEHGTLVAFSAKGESTIEIGDHTWIGPYNNLRTADQGRILIGRHCLISQFCTLITHNHAASRDKLIQSQGDDQSRKDILVGDDVWIGAGAVLLPGARIGDGAIVAAGAVVNATVPEYEIWGGVPARRIGERSANG